jgi:hypothetical protein
MGHATPPPTLQSSGCNPTQSDGAGGAAGGTGPFMGRTGEIGTDKYRLSRKRTQGEPLHDNTAVV